MRLIGLIQAAVHNITGRGDRWTAVIGQINGAANYRENDTRDRFVKHAATEYGFGRSVCGGNDRNDADFFNQINMTISAVSLS